MKKETRTDYYERIQRVISYIEEHLSEPLSLKTLSSIACFSEYHFHRIFVVFLGMTLQEYIIFRRLVRGATLLLNTSLRITDIALEAGFESHPSFTQAFKKYFSMSPLKFRKLRGHEKVEDALNEIIFNLNNEVNDQYGLRKMRSQKILYEKRTLPDLKAIVVTGKGMQDGSFFKAAKESFEKIIDYIDRNKLHDLIGCRLSMVPYTPLHLNDPNAEINCGFSMKGEFHLENGINIITIAGGNYKVFLHHGPYEYLSQTYKLAYYSSIFAEKDQLRNIPSFEIYLNSPLDTAPEDLKTEILIPVE